MEIDPLNYSQFTDSVETLKLRVLFCYIKYIPDIIAEYNPLRKMGRPLMTGEWVKAFILKELFEAIKSSNMPNVQNFYKGDFNKLLLDQFYWTNRHVKTGENYDIYLTITHILKSYRSDKDRVNDENLLKDTINLINEMNDFKSRN